MLHKMQLKVHLNIKRQINRLIGMPLNEFYTPLAAGWALSPGAHFLRLNLPERGEESVAN